jgi:hypothetical protein
MLLCEARVCRVLLGWVAHHGRHAQCAVTQHALLGMPWHVIADIMAVGMTNEVGQSSKGPFTRSALEESEGEVCEVCCWTCTLCMRQS